MAMAKKQAPPSSVAPSSEWPDKAVSILLKTYAQKFSVDRGYLRTLDWQQVAHAVNSVCDNPKTLKQCRDKVDSLKRRYKMEKRKAVNGGEVSWPFFHRLDDIMNSVLKQGKGHHQKHPNASSAHASTDADDGDYVDEVEELQEEDGKEDEVGDGDGEKEDEEEGADDDREKHEESNSHDSLLASSDSPPYLEDGKASGEEEDEYDFSDEDGALNGYPYRQLHCLYDDDKNHRHRQHQQGHHHPPTRHHPKHVYLAHHFLQPQLLCTSRPHSFSGGTKDSTENSSHGKANKAQSSAQRERKRKLECDNGIDALADAVRGVSKSGSATSFSDVFACIELAKMEILKKVKLEMAQLDRIHKKSGSPRKPHRAMSNSS